MKKQDAGSGQVDLRVRQIRQMMKEVCVICHSPTTEIYNINFTATAICKSCSNSIVLQKVTDLINRNV